MIDVIKNAFGKLFSKVSCNYEKCLTIYLIVNVIWIFFGMFFCSYMNFSYQDVSTSYVLLFILNIIFVFLLLFFKKIKFDKLDIFLLGLVVCGFISTIFSINSSVSIYGFYKRYEGFIQLLYYYSLMYLSSFIISNKCKKCVIYFILFFGLVNSFFSFLQVFDILKFIPVNHRGTTFAQALTVNSNFFGSYMVLCLGLSIGIFLYSKKVKSVEFFVSLFLCLCFFSSLLMSNAMSGIVGLFFIFICIFIYFIYMCIKKNNIKNNIFRYSILFVSFILVFLCLSCYNKTVIGKDIINFSKETTEMVKGNVSDSYGSFRIYVWRNTLKIVPKNLIHGVGIDCFFYAFGFEPLIAEFSSNEAVFFDKAHNEYLQKLICEGAFSCLIYIGMLFYIFICSVKKIFKENNYIAISLFLSFIGYSIQAFFNISVIEVAPLFWITIGLLYDRKFRNLKN